MAYIICGFPGVGKSSLYKHVSKFHKTVVYDSDSSLFPKDNFPENYLKHLDELITTSDDKTIILCSTHQQVVDGLINRGYSINIVVPTNTAIMKQVMIDRYKQRNNTANFISFISDNWNNFLNYIEQLRIDNKAHVTYISVKEDYLDCAYFNHMCPVEHYESLNRNSLDIYKYIDELIRNDIRELNNLGIKTYFSCSGHRSSFKTVIKRSPYSHCRKYVKGECITATPYLVMEFSIQLVELITNIQTQLNNSDSFCIELWRANTKFNGPLTIVIRGDNDDYYSIEKFKFALRYLIYKLKNVIR